MARHTVLLLFLQPPTVRQLLDLLRGQLGFTSVCLFADKDAPHVGAMYAVSEAERPPQA
jgi:hypothetical protein